MAKLFKKLTDRRSARGSKAVTGIDPGRGTSNTDQPTSDRGGRGRRGRRPDTPLGGGNQSL